MLLPSRPTRPKKPLPSLSDPRQQKNSPTTKAAKQHSPRDSSQTRKTGKGMISDRKSAKVSPTNGTDQGRGGGAKETNDKLPAPKDKKGTCVADRIDLNPSKVVGSRTEQKCRVCNEPDHAAAENGKELCDKHDKSLKAAAVLKGSVHRHEGKAATKMPNDRGKVR